MHSSLCAVIQPRVLASVVWSWAYALIILVLMPRRIVPDYNWSTIRLPQSRSTSLNIPILKCMPREKAHTPPLPPNMNMTPKPARFFLNAAYNFLCTLSILTWDFACRNHDYHHHHHCDASCIPPLILSQTYMSWVCPHNLHRSPRWRAWFVHARTSSHLHQRTA